MPRIRSLAIECYAQGARQADSVFDGIEYLGSLEEFNVDIYERGGFISMTAECNYVEKPDVEKHRKWDRESLEAALKEVINKHPGSFRVAIRTV